MFVFELIPRHITSPFGAGLNLEENRPIFASLLGKANEHDEASPNEGSDGPCWVRLPLADTRCTLRGGGFRHKDQMGSRSARRSFDSASLATTTSTAKTLLRATPRCKEIEQG